MSRVLYLCALLYTALLGAFVLLVARRLSRRARGDTPTPAWPLLLTGAGLVLLPVGAWAGGLNAVTAAYGVSVPTILSIGAVLAVLGAVVRR